MNKIYRLDENTAEYAIFIEQYEGLESRFFAKYGGWQTVDLSTYQPVKFKLYRADNGSRNFKTDISIQAPLIIFSEKAVGILREILEGAGQIIPIETDSKRKKFYGFYANKNVYDLSVVNLDQSEWRQAERGKLFQKVVLNASYPKEDYLFTLADEPMEVYVTEKFKALVEQHDLKGFDFSREVQVAG